MCSYTQFQFTMYCSFYPESKPVKPKLAPMPSSPPSSTTFSPPDTSVTMGDLPSIGDFSSFNSFDNEEGGECGDGFEPDKKKVHNLIEKKYRSSINDRICLLRDMVMKHTKDNKRVSPGYMFMYM